MNLFKLYRYPAVFFFSIMLVVSACSETEVTPPVPESELSNEDPLKQAIMDSAASVMRYYPDNVQLSITVVEDDTAFFMGILRKNDRLKEISNQDKVFEIGSVSKVFTGIILAHLVQQTDLSLESTLSGLGIPTNTDYSISMEQLATHTSGLPRVPGNMMWSAFFNRDNPYKNYDDEKLRTYLEEVMVPEKRPGTEYAYSNTGSGVLGYALEQHSGKDYQTLLSEVITTSLNMANTTTLRSEISEKLVEGRNVNGGPAENWDMNALMGAGGILSSPEDMRRFARAQWDTTRKDIQLSQNPRHPVSSGMQIGLGWHIIYREDGAWLWHNGGTGGYRSTIYVDEQRKKAVIILSNLSAGHSRSRAIDALGQDIMELVIGS